MVKCYYLHLLFLSFIVTVCDWQATIKVTYLLTLKKQWRNSHKARLGKCLKAPGYSGTPDATMPHHSGVADSESGLNFCCYRVYYNAWKIDCRTGRTVVWWPNDAEAERRICSNTRPVTVLSPRVINVVHLFTSFVVEQTGLGKFIFNKVLVYRAYLVSYNHFRWYNRSTGCPSEQKQMIYSVMEKYRQTIYCQTIVLFLQSKYRAHLKQL